jgi:hypothetical protein
MAALQELKARLGAWKQTPSLPCLFWEGGLPRGGLVEVSGHGKTEAVAAFLAEQKQPAAWVEKELSLFPSALLQRRVELEKILFVEAGKDSPWAATTILRAGIFPFLVYQAPYGEERELRRFQLLAEKSATTMFLLPPGKASRAWPIALSLEVRSGRAFSLRRK